jgi:hypothetical protein
VVPAEGSTEPVEDGETEPKEEEAREMTLDEWKAEQLRQRTKPTYNVRKANEGADSGQWNKYHVLDSKKKRNDDESDEEEEEEVSSGNNHIMSIYCSCVGSRFLAMLQGRYPWTLYDHSLFRFGIKSFTSPRCFPTKGDQTASAWVCDQEFSIS